MLSVETKGWACMKYIVILCDGMADEPLSELGGVTPLAYAHTPNMDLLASEGLIGMAKTVPDSMKPGSDVANLAVLGYDPERNYSGRSPLEALSVGVDMKPTDVVLRCNIVTVSEDEPFDKKTIIDHSAGEISTEDADILMDAVRAAFNCPEFQFHTGTSYRELTVWDHGQVVDLYQPHDHLGQVIGPYLPEQPALRRMMEESFRILNEHPLNLQRAAEGKNKANCLWFWGAGTKPGIANFREKYGLRGAMISAVDLLKGIAVGAGMEVIHVPGATGSLDTDYEGKANAAVKALLEDNFDFVYVHVEAPDEMGHQGSIEKKIKAIERIDSQVVGVVKSKLDRSGAHYRMLITPDHPTPIRIRTHTADPVPFVLYDSMLSRKTMVRYSEVDAADSGVYEPKGYNLINQLFEK